MRFLYPLLKTNQYFIHLTILALIGIARLVHLTPVFFDGSYFIFHLSLANNYANASNLSRLAGHIIYETPSLLALRFLDLGLSGVSYLYSASVIFLPFLSLIFAYFLIDKNKKEMYIFPVLSYLALLTVSLYFEVNEIQIANGMLWLVGCLLISKNREKLPHLLLLSLLLILLPFTYPLVALNAVAMILFILKDNSSKKYKTFALTIVLISLGMTLYSIKLHNQLMPETGENFNLALKNIFHNKVVFSSFLIFCALIISEILRKRGQFLFYLAIAVILAQMALHFSFKTYHLYDGRTVGSLILSLYFGFFLFYQFKEISPIGIYKKSWPILVLSSLAIIFYLSEWRALKKEVLSLREKFTGIVYWTTVEQHTQRFPHACTHWNSEMFTILIQHSSGVPVDFIVKRHPSAHPSFLDWMGKNSFFNSLEQRGVKINRNFFLSPKNEKI